ncbi:MAG: DUF4268 domain-containing protein [Luteimonas sp.]
MKAAIQTLGHVLYAPSQYVIPVFQRNYRWERPQWDKLWASLQEIQQPDKTGNHFMGFLVFVQGGIAQPGQNTRFHLIDGQQRLTTASLLLAAIRNVAERLKQPELAQEIHDYYLVHPLKKGENHYRLLPKAQDHDAYLAIIERKPPPSGRMADALEYFEGELDVRAAKDTEVLRRVFDSVCQRLEFMCATLESESAYSIFKSLNSTGVPLGQSDLIRNFVFMHVHPDAQDDFDHDHWAPLEAMFANCSGRLDEEQFSRFFRDVLMAEGQYVQPKDTFATFESRNEATGFVPMTLASRLMAHARHYSAITGKADDASPEITNALAELNRLESSTTYPLLLSLFAARDAQRLTSTELARCIEMLRGFIFRRFVAGESSRGYGQMFVRAIDTQAVQPAESLQQYLLDRGWPDDARFIEAFSLFPLYRRGYAREVLETLERTRGHKEQADLALAQIEHVMPQTLSAAWIEDLGDEPERVHADWLHRPGNLTLSAYNQEVGNQSFAVKRARFADSNIGLTRDLAVFAEWTEQEIKDRGLRMGCEAAALWGGPKEPHAADEVAVQRQETRALRLAFWTRFAEYLSYKYPELPSIEPVYKRSIRLKSGVPLILLEIRYKVQENGVAVDIYLNRKAVKLWERLREAPEHVNALVGDAWTFDQSPKGEYAWMTLERFASSSDPAHWPSLHGWLGQKLEQVYTQLLPYLQDELTLIAPSAMSSSIADDGGPTATKLLQQRYWGALADAVAARSTTLRPQKPLPQNWTNYAIGRTGFTITPTINSRDDRIGVELAINTSNAKQQFQVLLAQREAIEAALGFAMDWQELPGKFMSRIACWRTDTPPEAEARWPEYTAWMADRIVRMEAVFRPLVAGLE